MSIGNTMCEDCKLTLFKWLQEKLDETIVDRSWIINELLEELIADS